MFWLNSALLTCTHNSSISISIHQFIFGKTKPLYKTQQLQRNSLKEILQKNFTVKSSVRKQFWQAKNIRLAQRSVLKKS